ncbi:hypothetical protein [Acerihabitans sp.]|uniref:hypothetical protein n=1 Tax=Acerihabitans sp. TaxID=2811394 RepID=UPI002ED9D700
MMVLLSNLTLLFIVFAGFRSSRTEIMGLRFLAILPGGDASRYSINALEGLSNYLLLRQQQSRFLPKGGF